MTYLPLCLVDYIMKYKGAYHLNEDDRPYVSELHMLKDVLPAYGVRASILHLKEFYALKQEYDYNIWSACRLYTLS